MKTAVAAVLGIALLAAGVAMLVLPGPGFVVIAAGLAVLATRFDWAKKPLEYAKVKAGQGLDEVAQSRLKAAMAVLGALALVVVGIVEFTPVNLPLLNTFTAVFLVLSGLFLVGTVIYARRKASAPADPIL